MCVVLCCSLLCGYCSVFGAGGSVQVNTRGYPCRFPGTRLPYSTRKPDQYTRVLGSCPNPAGGTPVDFRVPGYPILPENPTNTLGFWGHARILPGIGLVFWFSIDGSQPYSTQHTHSTQHHHHHQGIAHQTAHSTPEWVCVLRPPRRLEGAGNNAASNGETLRYIAYIAFDIYRGIGKTPQPIDR